MPITLVVLLGAASAMIASGWTGAGATGLVIGVVLASAGLLLWVLALRGYRAGLRQSVAALWMLLRGREAPSMSAGLVEAPTPPRA